LAAYRDITILRKRGDKRGLIEASPVDRFESKRYARASRYCAGSHGIRALYVAQCGGKHRDAKTLSGFGGAGVVEVVTDFRSDTFRAVYTVRYEEALHVLHVFRKKSKAWRETPHREIELVRRRLREAEGIAGERMQ
jgi:phage-related protein